MSRNLRPKTVKLPSPDQIATRINSMKKEIDANSNYRTKSLAIHGAICAKCGRHFETSDLKLLTVHHLDGNHNNNPPDGSNWINLCCYCHDDEHSRELLGDYLQARK